MRHGECQRGLRRNLGQHRCTDGRNEELRARSAPRTRRHPAVRRRPGSCHPDWDYARSRPRSGRQVVYLGHDRNAPSIEEGRPGVELIRSHVATQLPTRDNSSSSLVVRPSPPPRYPRSMKFPPVQPFPDDAFTRVLCVVAHPDDLEYGTSSAVAAWTAKGIEVAYLLLTRGEAGIDTMDPKATAELRVCEQIKGSHEVGVTQVDFLDYPDGVLQYSIAMRRDIARAIRSFRPDALVAGACDVEFAIGLNQADHRVAGLAAVDAMRDAANRWVFPELLDGGLEPHSTRWLLTNGFEHATHGVDISGEPLERGIASLEAHVEYLAAIPGHPAPRDMISSFTALQGKSMGVPNGVLFRAWDSQARPALLEELQAAQEQRAYAADAANPDWMITHDGSIPS